MTTDSQILAALRESPCVSGAELSRKLGISRAAIWARIDDLRTQGYNIEASPHHGYRLVWAPDVLNADDLLARLGSNVVIGREIEIFQETTSTSDLVARLAQTGAPEGIVIFAESQSKGRGRMGRPWTSFMGRGLWFSVLLRPAFRPQSATQLTIASAVALARAIRSQTSVPAEIKWPNDILVGGKKVAGILTELCGELDCVNYAVLGIGIDVNQTAEELPPGLSETATSLRIAAGREIQRSDLAVAILTELEREYKRIGAGEFDAVAREWREQCTTLGRNVNIRQGARTISGVAETLDADGALLVRNEKGEQIPVTGGDMTLEKLR